MKFMRGSSNRIAGVLVVACCIGSLACQLTTVSADEPAQAQSVPDPQGDSVVIENQSELPGTYPGAQYEIYLHARGGVPPLHWRFENGALPPGIVLEPTGLLHGSPQRSGEFQFTVSVTDSGKPQHAVEKQFILRVRSAMTLQWKMPAAVNSNRIEGTAEVENTTSDDIDLTFVVLAVATDGRATAIGYQHFVLKSGTSKELPFGDTLPRGSYVVHLDAVGEVASKNLIYRERMQTPSLQVLVGP